MIDSLVGVTIVVPHLETAVAAYRDWLGYRSGPIGIVCAAMAERWGAPGSANARMAVMRPESGEARFIRLVEGRPDPDYRPMGSHGWAAAEIIVQDVEQLAMRLGARDCPFRIIGIPAVLDFDFTDKIKAMQVAGPGGEVLYLTEVGEAIPGFDLPPARSFVGQLFIVVLGAAQIEQAAATYAALGYGLGPQIQARIEVLSDAHDMPEDHRHTLATIALGESSLIEIDAFPATATPRALSSIGLPSGIAMVSFHGKPSASDAQTMYGTAGEWLEILSPSAIS